MIDIAWLAQHGPCKKYPEGETIPCPGGGAGDNEKAMYILLGGRVDVTGTPRKPAPAISLFPGDVFGGEEYFKNKAERVYTAAVDSVVYVITESSFTDLSWSQPETVFAVLRAAYIPQGKPTVKTISAMSRQEGTAAQSAAGFGSDVIVVDNADIAFAAAMSSEASSGCAGDWEEDLANDAAALGDDTSAGAMDAAADAGANDTSDAGATAVLNAIPIEGDIFPKGHKSYPGIVKPEFSSLVYEKDYTCPYCKQKFNDYKIFSSKLYESAPMRYDLRKFYTDFQSEWYDIVTCRHCYFSTVSGYYTESRPVLKQKIENELTAAQESVLLDFDAPRDIDYVFTSHYLALLCAEGYLSYAHPLRAKIWGNISWLYEDVEDTEMEVFAAEKAAAAYELVFSESRLSPVQEQMTCLSIAGMQMRAGIDRDLRKYLYQVRTAKMGDKAYVIMAENLMEDMRES